MKVYDPNEQDPERINYPDLPHRNEGVWIVAIIGFGVLMAALALAMLFFRPASAHSFYSGECCSSVCSKVGEVVDCEVRQRDNAAPLLSTPNVGGSSMGKPIAIQFSEKRKWGRLTPIKFVRNDFTSGGQKRPIWLFRCDCGVDVETRAYSVISGTTLSCGCHAIDAGRAASTTHGATIGGHTPEYKTWRNMLTRGRNPNIDNAEHYVLKGVTVAEEWLPGGDGKGFERFLAHIGPKPSNEHSLDRIDNDSNYEPGNVRWASPKEQMANRSDNRLIPYKGEMVPLTVAARLEGMKPGVLRDRIFKLKWPEHRWFEGRARAEYGKGKHSRPGVKARS